MRRAIRRPAARDRQARNRAPRRRLVLAIPSLAWSTWRAPACVPARRGPRTKIHQGPIERRYPPATDFALDISHRGHPMTHAQGGEVFLPGASVPITRPLLRVTF